MTVTVQYETLLKRATGTRSEQMEVDGPRNLQDVLEIVAERHGDSVKSLLYDSSGRLRPTLLIFVGDQQIGPSDAYALQNGDVVTLMAPISGG